MGTNSNIEWTDHTWNPFVGCSKVSEGCQHCYMFAGMRRWGKDPETVVRASRATFQKPLAKTRSGDWKWADGGRVFTASWTDVFHPDGAAWLPEVWAIIRQRPGLIFQLLTKRPERIAASLPDDWGQGWPNVWLGTTVENQERAEERIPALLSVPAQVRFLSCEPLLGTIDLSRWLLPLTPIPEAEAPETWAEFPWPAWVPAEVRSQIEGFWSPGMGRGPRRWLQNIRMQGSAPFGMRARQKNWAHPDAVEGRWVHCWNNIGRIVSDDGVVQYATIPRAGLLDPGPGSASFQGIQWVIAGGESGPKARPMHPNWPRILRDDCVAAGVPFLFKQWGRWTADVLTDSHPHGRWIDVLGEHLTQCITGDAEYLAPLGKKATGRQLDGRTWGEFPTHRALEVSRG